jgi:6,7-dimethyl-8-ribityllumazine synthase
MSGRDPAPRGGATGQADVVEHPLRFALCVGRFYEDLAEKLEAGARRALEGHALDVHDVAGAFELPQAAKYCALSGRYDGVVCLGAVIRGETDHYDWVCGEASRGIGAVGLETGVPCAFGVLTVDTHEQALARAGAGKRDSGAHAAEAVLALVAVKRGLAAV